MNQEDFSRDLLISCGPKEEWEIFVRVEQDASAVCEFLGRQESVQMHGVFHKSLFHVLRVCLFRPFLFSTPPSMYSLF